MKDKIEQVTDEPETEAEARQRRRLSAEAMGAKQRDISVSEFFAKNRHLLGFDNPRKALLTAVKEAVDNSLDACEEAGIVPEVWVHIETTGANRFKVGVLPPPDLRFLRLRPFVSRPSWKFCPLLREIWFLRSLRTH